MPCPKTQPILFAPWSEIVPCRGLHLNERYLGWLDNRSTVPFSEQRFNAYPLASCREYMKSFCDSPNYLWAIVAREPGLGHIGNINDCVEV